MMSFSAGYLQPEKSFISAVVTRSARMLQACRDDVMTREHLSL